MAKKPETTTEHTEEHTTSTTTPEPAAAAAPPHPEPATTPEHSAPQPAASAAAEHHEETQTRTETRRSASGSVVTAKKGWAGRILWGIGILLLIALVVGAILLAYVLFHSSAGGDNGELAAVRKQLNERTEELANATKKLKDCEPVKPVPEETTDSSAATQEDVKQLQELLNRIEAKVSPASSPVPAKQKSNCPCPPRGFKVDHLEWEGKGKLKLELESDDAARAVAEAKAAVAIRRLAEYRLMIQEKLQAIDNDREEQILEEIGRIRRQLDANEQRKQSPN